MMRTLQIEDTRFNRSTSEGRSRC